MNTHSKPRRIPGVTAAASALAKRRTVHILDFGHHHRWNLEQMLANAYLCGVVDTAQSLAIKGIEVEQLLEEPRAASWSPEDEEC